MGNFFVTGCTSGIGLGLTSELIRRGERVWGVALGKAGVERLRPELETGRFHYSPCDITRPEEISSVAAAMETAGFEPEVVILNAGINPERHGAPFCRELFNEVMQVNAAGALAWVDVFLPRFKAAKSGQFVAISSLSSYRGSAGLAAYCASKAALDRVFEALRAEHADKGVCFTTVNMHTVSAGMGAGKRSPLTLSLDDAVRGILDAARLRKDVVSLPAYFGPVLRLIQWIPDRFYRILRRALPGDAKN